MEYQDYPRAAHWMKIASETPDAPPWYRASYAGFLEESANRDVSLNYLKQKIEEQSNQTIRDYLRNKYQRVLHEMYQERIRELRQEFTSQFHRDIYDLSELNLQIEDPFERGWVLSQDGEIRSLHLDEILITKRRNQERHWIREAN